ncbi:IS3 family transposase [Mycoplasma phocimorsus]
MEFWFSSLKSEWFIHLNYKKLTYNKLKNEINNYINLYNKERIQKNLN